MTATARYGAIAAVFALALALAFVFRDAVLEGAISLGVRLATGYSVGVEHVRFARGHVALVGLHVARAGEPVLDAASIDVFYDLGELLRGGRHRFGLRAVAIDRPHVTIVRHKDGSLNLSIPGGGNGPPVQFTAPLDFTARVRDGSVEIRDPYNPSPLAHLLRIVAIDAAADVDSDHRTRYRMTAGIRGRIGQEPVASYPLSLAGTIDADHRYALQRIRAREIPVAGFVDYFVDSPAARFLSGDVRDLDVRIFDLDTAAAAPVNHFGGSFRVEGIGARVVGIDAPVGNLRGTLYLSDDGILAPRLDGDIDRTPIVTRGGFFGFAKPKFRIAVRGAADLRTLRSLFSFLRDQPVAGLVRFTTVIEGDVGNPLIFAHVVLPDVHWGAFPFARGHGLIAYYDNAVTMAPLEGHYGPIDATIRGRMALSNHIDSEFAVRIAGPGGALPYLDRLAPDMTLQGEAIAAGRDLPLHAHGLLYGAGPKTSLAAFVAVNEQGRGEFGPVSFTRSDGSEFSGSFTLDRPDSSSGFWAWARHYAFADPGPMKTLPGVTLPAFPDFGGTLDGAFAGGGAPSDFTLAGRVAGHGMEFIGIPVSRGSVAFGGTFHELRLGPIDATGPWGHIAGSGAVAIPGPFLLSGTYDGSLQSLRRFTGDIGASGGASGPFAVAVDGERIVVQTGGVRLRGARIHGIPLDSFDGTLAVDPGGRLDVYGARAGLGGGDLVAARSPSGRIAVAGAGLPLGGLGLAGFALQSGSVDLVGSAAIAAGAPTFDGALALSEGGYGSHRIDLSSELDYRGSSLTVGEATATLDDQLGWFDGTIGMSGTAPSLAVRAQIPAGDLGSLAAGFGLRLPYVTGSFGADVEVDGATARPRFRGSVAIPEGSINGLTFGDAAARVAGDLHAFELTGGTVRVGSTTAALAASYAGRGIGLSVRSDAADLADFNGFFDEGDMFAGRGRVALAYRSIGESSSSGDVALTGVRYRSFPIGDVTARWSSARGVADASLLMGGTSGSLAVAGTVSLPHGGPAALLQDASYDLHAKIAGLDVGTWLPAVGIRSPIVTGSLTVDGTIAGRGLAPTVDLSATLVDGTAGRIPIERASLAAHVARQDVSLSRLDVAVPHLSLTGDGTAGIAGEAPIALALHAHSDDVGALAGSVLRLPFALTGTADADVRVTGTRDKPAIAGGLELENGSAAGVVVPRVVGEFSLQGRSLVLEDAEVQLARGALTLAGSLPLTVSPFGIGPPDAAFSLDVDAQSVELSNFAPLLPKGSTLAGTLDGRFGVAGTPSAPELVGGLGLVRGNFALPGQPSLKNVTGRLSLAGHAVSLDGFHADAGSGTIDGTGRIVFPVAGSRVEYALSATAQHATVSLPGFFSGQLDGRVGLSQVGERPVIGGQMTITNATIPFGALFGAGSGIAGGSLVPNDLGFDLALTAGRNVRVRSGAIDIGGQGTVHLGGTIADPTLGGRFDANSGGTLVYFNRVFRVVHGTVTFDPSAGIVPVMDAQATTHVANTDPDPSRNPSGYADITIDVTGPVTGLDIALSSIPSYPREQILGLLLGASSLGAVNFAGAGSAPTTVGGTLNGAPQVTIGGLPPGLVGQQNGTLTVNQEAFGILNAQFTRALLSPIENTLGGALGLTTLDLTVDYGGSVGIAARKQLGKNVYALYGQSFNYPLRQTYGIEAQPNPSLSFQFTGFSQQGLAQFGTYPQNTYSTNQQVTAGQPPGGTSGFTFSVQRRYP